MGTRKFIDLPEATMNSDTPVDAPGTPNSTTTCLSTLSTIAIKDGQCGSTLPIASSLYGHQHRPSSNTLEAERADRISRLAGLERVSAVRFNEIISQGGAGPGSASPMLTFDANGNQAQTSKKSTVGSASATESMGERTATWASGSLRADDDYISLEPIDDRDRFSASGIDEDAERDSDDMSDSQSLVGFGEGAGSVGSGPMYTRSRGTTDEYQDGPPTPTALENIPQKEEILSVDSLSTESSGSSHADTVRHSEKENNER
ncbi:hypothetical protein GcM3_208014 [Golovinomyces cichoracearum]|uniref:Uncharacterized protein n=1 Tax=Golovinomyces cichoracearum TaxID=62708 RepID=A0A420HAV2_9PEZI|nr:hypothetical protein GcM3_208014 [Golovinomyces cichoracearum]